MACGKILLIFALNYLKSLQFCHIFATLFATLAFSLYICRGKKVLYYGKSWFIQDKGGSFGGLL